MNRTSVISGIIFILIAIILGAFGAHALKDKLSIEQLGSFEVGVKYQMYHGLALLILGFGASQLKFSLRGINTLIVVGVITFSLSIYFLAMQDMLGVELKFLGPITPIGGTLLIVAWFILLWKIISTKTPKSS